MTLKSSWLLNAVWAHEVKDIFVYLDNVIIFKAVSLYFLYHKNRWQLFLERWLEFILAKFLFTYWRNFMLLILALHFFCHLIFSPVVHLIFSFSRLPLCKTLLKNNCSWPVAISKLFLKPAMWCFFPCYSYAFLFNR